MRKVDLRMNELEKYNVIKDVVNEKKTKQEHKLSYHFPEDKLTYQFQNIKLMVKLVLYMVTEIENLFQRDKKI